MTKEEKKEQQRLKKNARQREWNRNNKELKADINKAWNLKNKEKKAAQNKAWIESKKDGLFTVYLLTKENYVGQTNNLHKRLSQHKNSSNRNVLDVQVLGKYNTREEARAVEDKYHNMGYLGAYHNL